MNQNRLSDSISTAATLSAGCASFAAGAGELTIGARKHSKQRFELSISSKNWRWGRSHVSLVASFEEARSNIGF